MKKKKNAQHTYYRFDKHTIVSTVELSDDDSEEEESSVATTAASVKYSNNSDTQCKCETSTPKETEEDNHLPPGGKELLDRNHLRVNLENYIQDFFFTKRDFG